MVGMVSTVRDNVALTVEFHTDATWLQDSVKEDVKWGLKVSPVIHVSAHSSRICSSVTLLKY